jgi:hypothetical protein
LSSKRPRHSAERPPPLAFADVKPILSRLERIAGSVVLGGGQAVNFWAELLRAPGPRHRPRGALLDFDEAMEAGGEAATCEPLAPRRSKQPPAEEQWRATHESVCV